MEERGTIYIFDSWHQFELACIELSENGDYSLDAACEAGCIAIKVNGIERIVHGTLC